ncbi:hypothetical protein UlMin_010569 [Ulmus minor]
MYGARKSIMVDTTCKMDFCSKNARETENKLCYYCDEKYELSYVCIEKKTITIFYLFYFFIRVSPYCCSQDDENTGAPQKFRVVENEGKCHLASYPFVLAEWVVNVAFPRDTLGEKRLHATFNIRKTRILEVDEERRKSSGKIGGSYALNTESKDANSLASYVGNGSVCRKNSCKSPCHVSGSPIDNLDNNCPLPPKEDLAAEIHGLELYAYCSLSWEQEELITNFRLSLHISLDEHLMEIRNLVSKDTSTQFR